MDSRKSKKADIIPSRPSTYNEEESEGEENAEQVVVKPKPRIKQVVIDLPWTRLFPKNGNLDFETYFRLKREERQAIMRHHAAAIIQAAWRGFLIRFNLKIVVVSIIKIQAVVRGFLARRRVKGRLSVRSEQTLADRKEKAAITIEAAWRGYWSRKTKFDYASYKKLQLKNEALKQSIDRINELEAALLDTLESGKDSQGSLGKKKKGRSIVDPCAGYRAKLDSFSQKLENMTPSLENMILDKLPELVNEMSPTRIAELYAYLANLEAELQTEDELQRQVEKLGGVQNLNPEQIYRLEESRKKQKHRAILILDLAKTDMMKPVRRNYLLKQKDSVDEMFPPLPDRADMVQPDRRKVESLKRAIRMFRKRRELTEEWELKKNHPLLRTFHVPGVFSDIYTTDLTDVEKRLKSVKFWKGSMAADRIRKKEEAAVAEKNLRLRRLFTHAMRITGRQSTPSNNGTADDEEELTTATAEEYDEYDGEEMETTEITPGNEGADADGENESEVDGGPSEASGRIEDYFLPPLEAPPMPPPPTPTMEI